MLSRTPEEDRRPLQRLPWSLKPSPFFLKQSPGFVFFFLPYHLYVQLLVPGWEALCSASMSHLLTGSETGQDGTLRAGRRGASVHAALPSGCFRPQRRVPGVYGYPGTGVLKQALA